MRVQHNIVAMNSYRNYNNNTKGINKNLEKLSSGYKINRAGDDAAGLAISEKMRAQITGLEGAQKNAKDGISLVQTAEGALTEVHSMLNRMYSLAEQSANGTYDTTTDRTQLQKEVDALRTEINRIADSANFNGIKLLDGSISGKSQVDNIAIKETIAQKGKYTTGAVAVTKTIVATDGTLLKNEDIGKQLTYTVDWMDAAGNKKQTTVALTFVGDNDPNNPTVSTTQGKNFFVDAAGTKYSTATGILAAADIASGIQAGLENDAEFAAAFEITNGGTSFTFTAKQAGSAGAKVTGMAMDETTSLEKAAIFSAASNSANLLVSEASAALDAMQKITSTAYSLVNSTMTTSEVNEKIFSIDGHRFVMGKLTNTQLENLEDDVTFVSTTETATGATTAKQLSAEINRVTGLTTQVMTSNTDANILAGDIVFTKDRLKLTGSDLKLQIGDTADSWNQMSVKVEDMHTSAMGIEFISITDSDKASDAMNKIKDAINYVSNTRGTLGATQNRLDHTINNLSVMQENIQDAESTIRDTDVADEMMKYTKNSILVQSAQAMLAQANQQPQGVLQLLQ